MTIGKSTVSGTVFTALRAAVFVPCLLLACSTAAQEPAKRIVAAGGVITEIIYALGRQDLLVGVDSTSQFPPQALKERPDIGYVRALSSEGILSLAPDQVLAVEGAGPPDTLRLIREAKIAVITIPEDLTESGVLRRIRMIGAMTGTAPPAEALATSVAARFAALAEERARIPRARRVLFVLSIQNGRVMAGGRNTAAAAIIEMAGGINAAGAVEGYKPLSDEGVIAAAPDIILMMQRGDHAAKPEEIFAHPAFQAIPAAKTRALVSMDGLYLLGFGPRTPNAGRDLMLAIYTDHPAALNWKAEIQPGSPIR